MSACPAGRVGAIAEKRLVIGAWHESDEFWETVAPLFFPEGRWKATPKEVDHLLRLLDLAPGAAVLDLGCGPGRHALELARRGYRVTGVDRTKLYLDEARAQAGNLPVEFVGADMREFCRPQAYAGVVNLFSSFGYFEDRNDNVQVLVNMYRSLQPGGTAVLEMRGKEVVAREFQERNWIERPGGQLLETCQVSHDWSRLNLRWILLDGNSRREFSWSHWIYSAVELAGLLEEAGFQNVAFCGDLSGAPYDHHARHLVAIAKKDHANTLS